MDFLKFFALCIVLLAFLCAGAFFFAMAMLYMAVGEIKALAALFACAVCIFAIYKLWRTLEW